MRSINRYCFKMKKSKKIEKKGIQILQNGKIKSENKRICSVIRKPQQSVLPLGRMTILLDPGNGGKSKNGIYSGSEDMLKLCVMLKKKLEKAGAEVILTRESDIFCPISCKAEKAAEINPHFFISINCNYAENKTVSGTEIFHYRGDEESALLARLICEELKKRDLFLQKGVKVADLSLLREIKSKALIIEIGYISNENDKMILTGESGKEAVSHAICSAFENYCLKSAAAFENKK